MIMQVHSLTCKAQNRPKLLICFDREGINVLQFLSMEFGHPFFFGYFVKSWHTYVQEKKPNNFGNFQLMKGQSIIHNDH